MENTVIVNVDDPSLLSAGNPVSTVSEEAPNLVGSFSHANYTVIPRVDLFQE